MEHLIITAIFAAPMILCFCIGYMVGRSSLVKELNEVTESD